jgi:hypothetical protein
MDKETFISGASWISLSDLGDAAAKSRLNLGAAFSWSDPAWYTSREPLSEVWQMIEGDAQLVADMDSALDDQQRSAWLERVVVLKLGVVHLPSVEDPTGLDEEPTADEGSVEEVPLGQAAMDEPKPEPRASIFARKKPVDDAGPVAEDQSVVGARPVPRYTGGKPGLARLLTGVLEQTTVDAAVARMYENLHHHMGLRYVSEGSSSLSGIMTGASSTGMCETFALAFKQGLAEYKELKKDHPLKEVRDGALEFEVHNVSNGRFVTRKGLNLIGGLAGNVYLEVDGKGNCLANGFDKINRFVFFRHWTITVNGKVYDPIFESVDEDNIEIDLDPKRNYEGGRFLANPNILHPGRPFGASYIWVHDWADFSATVEAMRKLYISRKKEIDGMTEGRVSLRDGLMTKSDRSSYARAKKIVKAGVADPEVFLKVVADASPISDQFDDTDLEAVNKVLHLASLKP